MITIGITGIMGSGKSTLARLLGKDYPVLSTDKINYDLQQKGEKGYLAIVKEYSSSILDENQEIDRAKLASIVFSDQEAKNKLETIMHPLVKEEMDDQLANLQQEQFCFVEVPLLFEKGWEKYFDYTVTISGDVVEIKKRLQKERNLSLQQIEERMSQQFSQEEKEKKADFIIKNDGSMEELEKKVVQLIEQLNRLD